MNTSTVSVEPLWSVNDVADYLGVPIATLYQWRAKKYGPAGLRLGRHLRYRRADVESWLDTVTEDH